MSDVTASVSRREALWAWVRVALVSFGGPAGQIAVVHRIIVEEKRWLSEERFLHALSYCMLLPGPEAQQLTTYVGWLMHGVRGGLTAGLLFILPGFLSILALSVLYTTYHEVDFVAAVFFGLKPAVLAIVFQAVGRFRRRALAEPLHVSLAVGAFIAIFFLAIPFPLVVAGAGLTALTFKAFRGTRAATSPSEPGISLGRVDLLVAARTVSIWLLVWLAPLASLVLLLGADHVFVREGLFFSKVAVVTFGGAYAVLSYVAQQAVDAYHWLLPGQMLDGLGMAETTPGPLIQVVQFVGFLGAYGNPGTLHPLVAGIIGSAVTTWVTFAPCFLFIFAGAPFVERLRDHAALNNALRGITAAVVGVVMNLAVWFALHTLFGEVVTQNAGIVQLQVPTLSTIDWRAVVIAVAALVAVFRYKANMFLVLGGSVVMGMLLY